MRDADTALSNRDQRGAAIVLGLAAAKLVGMRVARGFTQHARAAVGGSAGCHRVSELVVEIAQAAYQLHFVRFFGSLPREVREGEDVPAARHAAVLQAVPGMRNTCFSYNDEHRQLIVERGTPLKRRSQTMPRRDIATDPTVNCS